MKFRIRRLPVIQNWSCHSCGNCCREYFVTVTDEERQRIEAQGWAARPGFHDGPLFVPYRGPRWRKEYRLAHRADGSCVFLDERGLCRIHAEFGETAKPIACQLYPYMLVPAGDELRVSVRFSCPSAARNLGRPVADQEEQIRQYARQLVPAGARPVPTAALGARQQLAWPDLLACIDMIERLLADRAVELPARLIRALAFVRLLEEAQFDKLQGKRFRAFLDLAWDACVADAGATPECAPWAGVLFRLMVAQCARKDLSPHLRSGLAGRWRLLQAARRFARGRGIIPRLQPLFGEVAFDQVEQPFGGPPPDAGAMLERYYRIKTTGIQFFGNPFYGVPMIEGFYSLALTYPAILWIARWLAAGAGRRQLATDDVATALTVVDHQWGFAPVFGFGYARRRVRLLAGQRQIEPLIRRYSQ